MDHTEVEMATRGIPYGARARRESKYNRGDSAGYKSCHVRKIIRGRERNMEREGSGRFIYRPALALGTRKYGSLVASCKR
jgi:hypothetical protein